MTETVLGFAFSSDFPDEHLWPIVGWFLDPRNWIVIGTITATLSAAFAKLYKTMIQKMDLYIKENEERQNKQISKLDEGLLGLQTYLEQRTTENELMILRVQIQTGVYTGLLTESEILNLYDEYKDKGGNSYISRIVEDHLRERRERREN